MKIGVIGAATVGLALATRLAALGHEVRIASKAGAQALEDRLSEAGVALTAASIAEAAQSDVVFLAVPWIRVREVLTPQIPWNGRVLVDATNIFTRYAPDFAVDDLKGDSGSEIIARLAPTTRVVKAFNTIPFSQMFTSLPTGYRRVLFVAGDDTAANTMIAGLIQAMGLHPIVLGPLAVAGRQMELGGPLSGLELLHPAN